MNFYALAGFALILTTLVACPFIRENLCDSGDILPRKSEILSYRQWFE